MKKKATWGLEANRLSFSEWRRVIQLWEEIAHALVPPLAFNKKRKKKATRQEKWGSVYTNLRNKNKGMAVSSVCWHSARPFNSAVTARGKKKQTHITHVHKANERSTFSSLPSQKTFITIITRREFFLSFFLAGCGGKRKYKSQGARKCGGGSHFTDRRRHGPAATEMFFFVFFGRVTCSSTVWRREGSIYSGQQGSIALLGW
jgi:hypothetical protein